MTLDDAAPLLPNAVRDSGSRRVAYALSISACLLSASFTVFSLYTDAFQEQLGFSAFEINIVSIAAEAGLYLCVPFLGYMADAVRLSSVSLVSSVCYILGYGGCAIGFHYGCSYIWMASSFAIVGIACSALFVSSLVSCARLYPASALLAIAAPTTCYGLSSLAYSQAVSRALHVVQPETVMKVLAVGLASVGVVAFTAPRIGKVDGNDPVPTQGVHEIPGEPPVSYIRKFMHDHDAWKFLATFILVSGPLEMYQNNLALISRPQPTAPQVALFSTFSTIARLCVGAYTDLYDVEPHKLLVLMLVVVAAVEACVAQPYFDFSISSTSSVSGFAYGAVFTLYPLVVSRTWGIEGFATYWGMFILGPAVGSLLFGLLFAFDYDGLGSYSLTFWLSAAAMLVSALITYKVSRIW